MKISKLFHWLYAILMLLPFLVFLPNAFYYGFNEHAVAQEKTEQVPVNYETNEVNTYNDLIVGNAYQFDIPNTYFNNFVILISDYKNIGYTLIQTKTTSTTLETPLLTNDGSTGFDIKLNQDQPNNTLNIYGKIAFIFKGYTTINNDILQYINPYYDYFKEYQPLTTSMSITDSMSYAWDSVWQNDLFSWSYGSFLTEPFIYIGNVFNVPVDNSLYYALSYWLDISIIWLCFDVIMYVPLLVHRWLDKGIVE